MSELWGLSSVEFVALYCVGLVATTGLGWLLRRWARRRSTDPTGQRGLGDDELAFLAGGPVRVAETSLARLVEAGTVRVSRDGRVRATDRTDAGSVDAATLAELGARPRTSSVVLRRVAASPAVTSIGDVLAARGLVVVPAVARRIQWTVAAVFGALLAVGLARFVLGVVDDRPIAYVAVLLPVTVAVAVFVTRWPEPRRTARGDAVLAAARTSQTERVAGLAGIAGSGELLLLGGAATAVALGGLAAFPDDDIQYALGARSEQQAGTTGCGGGCGTSSCGGGTSGGGTSGCGGGGCGSGG